MSSYSYLNGKILVEEEANVKLTDLAILRGYGVFDFFLFYKGHPLFLDDYLDRFMQSAAMLNLELPSDKAQLKSGIYELIAANNAMDGAIRLVATGGYAPDGYSPESPNLIILQHPLPKYPDAYYQDGVKLLSKVYQREIPRAKTINYLMGITAIPQLKAANAIEVLYHDGRFLRETVRANFFLVTPEDTLITPADKILMGVTRKTTLGVARQMMRVEEREVGVEEMQTAKEAFLTSSTRGVMPVVKVDDLLIGNGRPGVFTQKLMDGLRKVQRDYITKQELTLNRQS